MIDKNGDITDPLPIGQDKVLLLQYHRPQKVLDVAAMSIMALDMYRVSLLHKLTIEESGERAHAKKIATEKINTHGPGVEKRSADQLIAISKIDYWETALEAAKEAARIACEMDLGNLKYLKYLSDLQEIVI